MANRDNPCGFKVFSCNWPSIPTRQAILRNGATITATDDGADAVVVGTDGFLGIALTTDTAIAGIAKYTATGDGSTYVQYTPAYPGILFEGQCSGTEAQTDIGQTCDIEGTTGIQELNEDAGSTNVVIPVQLHPASTTGANARLVFEFKSQWVL